MNSTRAVKPYDQQLANWLVRPLKETFIHPNHLTAITLILGITASLLFAFFGKTMASLASILYMLAVFSDHLDGELARMTGKTSKFGHDFDYIVGGINYTALFCCLGYGLSATASLWILILGLAAGLSNPYILFLRMKMEQQHGTNAVEHPAFGRFEIEDGIYLIGPITWYLGIFYFFVPYAIGTLGYLCWTIYEFRKWNDKQSADK